MKCDVIRSGDGHRRTVPDRDTRGQWKRSEIGKNTVVRSHMQGRTGVEDPTAIREPITNMLLRAATSPDWSQLDGARRRGRILGGSSYGVECLLRGQILGQLREAWASWSTPCRRPLLSLGGAQRIAKPRGSRLCAARVVGGRRSTCRPPAVNTFLLFVATVAAGLATRGVVATATL